VRRLSCAALAGNNPSALTSLWLRRTPEDALYNQYFYASNTIAMLVKVRAGRRTGGRVTVS
jgi:hypothetical protein